jgi:hypothetical protein
MGHQHAILITSDIRFWFATHLALCTNGVFVNTLLPGMAGIAHDATGLGDRSTCMWYQIQKSAPIFLASTFTRNH